MVTKEMIDTALERSAFEETKHDMAKVALKGFLCVTFGYTAYKLGRATISQQLPEPRRFVVNQVKKALSGIIN